VAAWLCLPWRSGEEEKNKEYATSNRNEGEQDRGKNEEYPVAQPPAEAGWSSSYTSSFGVSAGRRRGWWSLGCRRNESGEAMAARRGASICARVMFGRRCDVCAQVRDSDRSRTGAKSGLEVVVRRGQDWERWRRKEEKHELSPGGREMAGRPNPA
jgi:hypothetical protein